MTQPALLSWLRAAARNVSVEPLIADLRDVHDGHPHGHVLWAVYVVNDDETERAHIATCSTEIDAELVAEALQQLAQQVDT